MNDDVYIERTRLAFLVCFAVREEAAFATPLPMVKGGREMLVTGMGRRNASEHFSQALDKLSPDRVLTCGFAGALDPKYKIGDVLFDEDFDAGFGEKLKTLGAIPAKFYCSTRVAITAGEKSELLKTTGADAVEMESSVIRTLCHQRKIPSATIRVISDTALEDLPVDFNAVMTSDQKISIPKFALALIKSPRRIRGLMRLQTNTREAAKSLAKVLEGLLRSAG